MLILVVLLVYNSILTISDEVDFVWCHKLTVSSAIFITNYAATVLLVVNAFLIRADNVRHALRSDNHPLIILSLVFE